MSNMSNAAAAVPPETAAWCENFSGFALALAQAFLILALIVALVETAIGLWAKLQAARKAPDAVKAAEGQEALAVDPVKLLEALKAVLEALKGLPAWIAIFLAGLALLWMTGQKPELCPAPGSPGNEVNTSRPASNDSNVARPDAPVSNAQAPAATNRVQ